MPPPLPLQSASRTTINELLELMEPAAANTAVDTLHSEGLMQLAHVSSAISLKRIADCLEMTKDDDDEGITLPQLLLRLVKAAESVNVATIFNDAGIHGSITNLAWEAGRSFAGGMRTDR